MPIRTVSQGACTMIRQRGRPQPRIAEAHLRKLSSLATRYGIQMTHLLNLIVATALEELERAADVCDEGKTARSAGQDHRRELHHRVTTTADQPAHPRPKKPRRSRISHVHALRHRH